MRIPYYVQQIRQISEFQDTSLCLRQAGELVIFKSIYVSTFLEIIACMIFPPLYIRPLAASFIRAHIQDHQPLCENPSAEPVSFYFFNIPSKSLSLFYISFICSSHVNLRSFSIAMSHAEMSFLSFKNTLRRFHGTFHQSSVLRPRHVSVLVYPTQGKMDTEGTVRHLQAEQPETTMESSFKLLCGSGVGKEAEEH